MKASIDQDLCIGCGLCSSLCPDCFEMREDTGKAHVREGADCDAAGCCREAEEECPVQAIEVRE